jgi:hypothetical protein
MFSMSAEGQEIRWQPVDATGNIVSISDAPPEIVLSGGGVTVTLFMEVSGWDPDVNGDPSLGAYQGSLLATTLVGPGDCILTTVGSETGMGFEGAFQSLKVCGDIFNPDDFDPLIPCDTIADCPTGRFCIERPDYVFYQLDNTPTVSTATANFAWSSASTDCKVDPGGGERFYGGTLLINVPDLCCPPWDVGFVDDSDFTLFNSCPGPLIPFGENGLVSGRISIERGSCCYGIGTAGAGCADNVCADDCNALPGPRDFRPGVDCTVECCACTTDLDCRDPYPSQVGNDNLCTDDSCSDCVCTNTDNYEVGVVCCDPETGGTVPIDDDNVCTDDSCDAETGVVTNDPNTDPCNDGNGCTYADICGGGICEGSDINEVACVDATDCDFGVDGAFPCEFDPARQGNFCKCSLCTPLIVAATDSAVKDPNCYAAGEDVEVVISIGPGSERITGAQFTLLFDDCLEFESIGPCEGSVFDTNPYMSVTADGVFYVATIEPFKRCSIDGNKCFDENDCDQSGEAQTCDLTIGSKGPAALACATFSQVTSCDKCGVCVGGDNPMDVTLSNDEGYAVDICDPIECDAVRVAGDLTISAPDGVMSNADCNMATAYHTWDMPFATDTCDDPDPMVSCDGVYLDIFNRGMPTTTVEDIIWTGGDIPQGQWWFVCDAENSCGNVAREVWTVYVSDQHTLDVEVELGAPVITGQLSRCICFELYANCWDEPTRECQVLDFGPPDNFRRHAHGQIKVDKGNYVCITAADELHTLRQSADIACVDNAWTATWKGDPYLGGNWLPGGNLDGCKEAGVGSPYTIDVLDFGKFMHVIASGAVYTSGDTDCLTECPHGDINGDGVVDNTDYSIIQMNFLMAKKDECCPDRAAAPIVPVTEMTVKQLRQAGLYDLIVADLNKDGVLNVKDMETYEAGVRPVQDVRIRKHGTR